MPRKKKIEVEDLGSEAETIEVVVDVPANDCAKCGKPLNGYVENNGKKYCNPACAA